MADPLSITTAIITLGNTLHRVVTLLSDFKNAPAKVQEVQRDCAFTQGVLENIQQQLKSTVLPTLSGDGTDGGQGSAGLNLAKLLEDNVIQLQLDIRALLDEIELMTSPGVSESKIGKWLSKTNVAWKTQYFSDMQQQILTKRSQLQLVESSLQSQVHSAAILDQQVSHDEVAALLSGILNPTRRQYQTTRRRSSATSNPTSASKYSAQENLVAAVRKNKKREAEALLQHIDPNFHSDDREELYPLCIASINGDLAMIDLLLSYGAKINCYTQDRRTPLMLALLNNHPVAALALIRRGADISLTDAQGKTALHFAAHRNLYAVVQVLLQNGAHPNAYDLDGRTPVMEAICRVDREIQPQDTSVLRVLLEPNNNGVAASATLGELKSHYNPVHHAARKGFLPDLKTIAASKQAMRALACSSQDASGRTPLWYAARRGRLDVVRFLVNLNPPDVRHVSRDAEAPTPLWAVVESKSPEMISGASILLAAGAEPNGRNTRGHTLMHRVCELGNLSLVELLLQKGADPRLEDDEGKQPLHYAAVEGHEDVVARLLGWELGRVDVDCADGEGRTPLIVAASKGHDFLVRALIEKGADWRKRDRRGGDAFYVACTWGHVLCAAYLLGKGADINVVNKQGNTPLHAAARMGQLQTVRWLLRMGADKSVESKEPFDGLEVKGTAADVARAVGGKTGEAIASLIEVWEPARGREFGFRVAMEPLST
ncbi:ankyrin repeat-containing domain protein [Echria macrotheca]|uniref:Ankyrin repeat-containing domain protein n=1 Tax=Echria macrotheca TaxID=438768 RepID=A0AAJ0B7N0_9PEZI|nr:ankyrin repeat-containing domain protein [Echria macrotheca]